MISGPFGARVRRERITMDPNILFGAVRIR